jgi:hypothetical protein
MRARALLRLPLNTQLDCIHWCVDILPAAFLPIAV